MKHKSTYNLAAAAIIAALYAALTFASSPIAFGAVQFRISEALTILPLFTPIAIPGLTVGCLLANCIGLAMGLTMPPDLLFGTSATLIAALLTYAIGRCPLKPVRLILGPFPAVLCNGIIVGIELTVFLGGSLLLNMAWVALGELVVCYVLGLLLAFVLGRNGLYRKIFPARAV